MPPVAVIAGAAAIGAGANIFGANKQADAARDAANIQASAEKYASDQQMNMFNQQQANMQPYTQAGQAAMGRLAGMAGNQTLNPSADPRYQQIAGQAMQANPASDPRYQAMQNQMLSPFSFNQSDPSYQFRFGEGQRALESSAAAKGGYFSGNTGLALQNYGQQAASQEYGNEFNRYLQQGNYDLNAYNSQASNYLQNQQMLGNEYQGAWNRGMSENQNNYNQVAGVANMGLSAQGQVGQWGMNTGQNMAQNTMNAGAAQGQGVLNQGNAWAGAAQGINNQLQNVAGQYLNYNAMNTLNPGVADYSTQNTSMINQLQAPQLQYQPTSWNLYGGRS